MSVEESKALVRPYWEEAWNQGNLDVLDEILSPERAELEKWFITRTREAFPDGSVAIEDVIAEWDKVVTR